MDDEQLKTPDEAPPEGAVDPDTLKADPGPPKHDDDNMAGPRKVADERAREAAEMAREAAERDAQRSDY